MYIYIYICIIYVKKISIKSTHFAIRPVTLRNSTSLKAAEMPVELAYNYSSMLLLYSIVC